MTAARRVPLAFAELIGWAADAHAEAFAAFRRSAEHMARHPYPTGALGIDGAALAAVSHESLTLPENPGDAAACAFFERWFQPVAIMAGEGGALLTGYFEPEVAGSRVRTARFTVPLLARPRDLVDVTDANRPENWPSDYVFARQTPVGLVPYHTRGEIEDGALDGRGLELVFVEDPVDAFFIHVQGSCRIRFEDGSGMRLSYDGKAGHPYTSLGKRLIERGVATPEAMTADVLAAWLRANRVEGRALMRENRSYVFFHEMEGLDPDLGAIAAAGVQITPGRSLAVDHRLHTYGTPVWLAARLPQAPDGGIRPFNRLMVAQDTGSAIVGAARGDVFVGAGAAAGHLAGQIRHAPEQFVIFVPQPNRS